MTFLTEGNIQHDFFQVNMPIKIGLHFANSMCQLVSILLLPCIIYFELNSGDPLKRTILNKIISGISSATIVLNLTCGTFLQIRFFTGNEIDYNVALWAFELPKVILADLGCLYTFEYILVRYMCICIWKRAPPPINEDFWWVFLTLLNICLATFWGIMQTCGHIVSEELMVMISGVYPPHQDMPHL